MGAGVSCNAELTREAALDVIGADAWSADVDLRWKALAEAGGGEVSAAAAAREAAALGLHTPGAASAETAADSETAAGETAAVEPASSEPAAGEPADGGPAAVPEGPAGCSPYAGAFGGTGPRAFVRACGASTALGGVRELLRSSTSPDLGVERRARVKTAANAALAAFEDMPDDERNTSQHREGVASYTAAAQLQREDLFASDAGVGAALEHWWLCASRSDENGGHAEGELSAGASERFHARFLRLALADGDGRAAAALAQDLHVGVGGILTHEAFRYAVFSLADRRTETLNSDDYVAFLQTSFATVFRDQLAGDAVELPQSWTDALEAWSGEGDALEAEAAPRSAVVEVISEIVCAKLTSDGASPLPRAHRPCLAQCTLDSFAAFGGNRAKRFRDFCSGVTELCDDATFAHRDLVLVFAVLCGCACRSGRLGACDGARAAFAMDFLRALQPATLQPIGLCGGDVAAGAEPRRARLLDEAVDAARDTAHAACFGWLEAAAVERLLVAAVAAEYGGAADAVLDCAKRAFDALVSPRDVDVFGDAVRVDLVRAVDALTLVAAVAAACGQRHKDGAAACGTTKDDEPRAPALAPRYGALDAAVLENGDALASHCDALAGAGDAARAAACPYPTCEASSAGVRKAS
ncbi:hypothetical protein M885DRAFT_618797 [Pelagophyceae sp. CCMP2097]|nr:hypothetical protein M885DRAFT_618797 [Pelagophyceae sp. CCMP2097]